MTVCVIILKGPKWSSSLPALMEENETRQNNIGSMSTGSIAAKICSIYNIYLICTMATCIKDSYSTIPEKNRPYAYLDTSIKK